MTKRKGPDSIIFLSKTSFQFFGSTTSKVLSIGFPENILKDIEVVSKEGMAKAISDLIDKNAIAPSDTYLVFSESISFSKDIGNSNTDMASVISDFSSSVPFDSVEVKAYRTKGGFRIIGTNKNYYKAVSEGFKDKGFEVLAVTPAFAIGASNINELTADSAKELLKRKDAIINQSILKIKEAKTEPKTENGQGKKNSRVTFLASILGIGILILIAIMALR